MAITRYIDKDLKHFKSLIEEKIEKAQKDLALIKSAYMNDGNNGTEDTSPTFKSLMNFSCRIASAVLASLDIV